MIEPNTQTLNSNNLTPNRNWPLRVHGRKTALCLALLVTNLAVMTGCVGFTPPTKTPAPTAATIKITSSSLPAAGSQSAYAIKLTAAGGVPPYSWSATAGHLPNGLTLTSAGAITGIPTTTGTFSFTATAQDSKGLMASAAFSIVVTPATSSSTGSSPLPTPPPPVANVFPLQITTTALPGGTVNSNYSMDLTATGGTAPYAWSLVAGHLPTGLALNAVGGVISGTPTSAGTFAITAAVQDSKGATVAAGLSVNIAAAPATAPPPGPGVLATAANTFIDSIGVATHWMYPSYITHLSVLQNLMTSSGIRHFRDGANLGMPGVMQAFGTSKVKVTLLIDPTHGIVPNTTYWSASPPGSTVQIADFIKNYMPADSVEALEMPNELDVFYYLYKWHPSDASFLSTNPSAPNYYGAYGEAVTKDSWQAIKSDPALANIRIIGPTVGIQVPSPYSAGSLYDYVDTGGFHPYPGRANTFTYPQPYDTIQKYYWNSFQPSVNVSSDPYGGNPLMFTWYQPPFAKGYNARPMVATETGYQTGSKTQGGISVLAQAKYVPRLFAEYFRNGIARTFIYEFYDEGTNPADQEQNFGLIYNNLTPKPAFTALANLIQLLSEPDTSFTPGKLDYSLEVQPNGAYVRTKYVHDLLLEKSDGDFYLLLWHEISGTSNTDVTGNSLAGAQRDIAPPALQTTITLPASINSATLYSYDAAWQLDPQPLSIAGGKIMVSASDAINVIRLSRK